MTSETAPERPKARDDVVFRQLDEEWVLFDPVANRLHVLNLTAALIWTHLTGDMTVGQLAEAVRSAFGHASSADLSKDVEQAVSRFSAEGLLA
jgi:hypothetical protein